MSATPEARFLSFTLIALAAILAPRPGCADAAASPALETIQLSIGEPVQDVRSALKVDEGSRKVRRRRDQSILMPERGISAVVGPGNLVGEYMFYAPFAGAVHGAKIGDSVEHIRAVLGPPTSTNPNNVAPMFLYQLDGSLTLLCDFDTDGVLQRIRVVRGAITFTEPPPLAVAAQPVHAPITPSVTTQGGVTNLSVPGNLGISHELDCLTLDHVDTTDTPPDLYAAIPRCLAANRYEDAGRLFALAGAEASFDAMRVTDKTAGQARQVLIMNTFYPLPDDQRQKFHDTYAAMTADAKALSDLCNLVRKFPPPSYYPQYMILHGIKAFTGDPFDITLEPHFDAQSAWIEVQRKYLNCKVP